jgi:hypothetical protein
MKKYEQYIQEAIENINSDRQKAESLLKDASVYIGENQERHQTVGAVAAKYLETLQRSNEQLVRILGLMSKYAEIEMDDLKSGDVDNIYEQLEEEDAGSIKKEKKRGKK